jgi:hypothetical protein
MTRRLFYLRDKLSRQSLMPKLAEFRSTSRIRSLAQRERLAPILRRQLASLIDATRNGSKDFKLFPLLKSDCWSEQPPTAAVSFWGLPLIGADHQSNAYPHPSFLAAVSLGDLSLIGAVDVLQTRPEEHRLF